MEMYKDSSFIKVLAEPISSTLMFPDEFVRKYGEMLPQEAFLMTEEKYGQCWKVKVARLHSGRFCFANGWPQFIDENPSIFASDFAVFQLVDATTFQVSVFGSDGLKKPSSALRGAPSLPPQADVENNMRAESPIQCTERGQSSRRGVEMTGTKSFTVKSLAQHHLYCLNIPMRFAEETGIAFIRDITLKNEDGVSWELKVQTREKDGRICLRGVDWADFWVKNCLTFGNKVTFSIVGDDIGTLHMSREGFVVPSLPKKSCGRPYKY